MIFGTSTDEILEAAFEGYEDSSEAVAMREAISDLRTWSGRVRAKSRTSLAELPSLKHLRGIDRLSKETVQMLSDAVGKMPVSSGPPSEATLIDSLDTYYSQEVLGKLEGIVRRASTLQRLKPKEISNPDLLNYFEEAHSCFLYGFRIAGAVLCRAILETALKELFDPNGTVERKMKKQGGRGDSYFAQLVIAAGSSLKDDRPKCALNVRDAGGYAIHDLSRFNMRYPPEKASQILDDTRKVLLDLLGQEKLAEE